MSLSDLPLEPLVKPAPELSLIGKWRWNVLAALFAALLLVALTLRRWRRAEISEPGEALDRGCHRVGIQVSLVIVLAALVLTGVLALFPLGGDAAAVPMASEAIAAIDSANEASSDFRCAQCGVVESTREIAPISDQSAKSVEVTVRMKDGASHLFVAASPATSTTSASSVNSVNSPPPESLATWRAGERVIFIAGRRLAGQ